MRKIVAALLTASIVLGAASAETLNLAAQNTSPRRLECYTGYSQDGETWQTHGVLADAALYYMNQRAGDLAYQGACLFYLELTGSESLGLIVPRLEMYYVNNTPSEATAVSLAFGGTRYDLDVAREETTVGGRRAEKLTAYLNEEGLDMLRALQSADEVTVRLHGSQVYTTTLARAESTQVKKRLENASLSASEDMLSELDAMHMDSYDLWELSENAYRQQFGDFFPMTSLSLADETEGFKLDELGQLTRGDTGESVRALQNLLIEKGFMLGTPDNAYGEGTAVAVRRAQAYYGLRTTGSCDEALIALLRGESLAVPLADEGAQAVVEAADGACTVSLGRYYLAEAVSASAQPLTAARTVTNADNTLVIAEGQIVNRSGDEVNLYWQMTGTLTIDGYAYKAEALCESNEGESLDSALLPLAGGRLLVVAEIPKSACLRTGEWTLSLQMGEQTWEYALER